MIFATHTSQIMQLNRVLEIFILWKQKMRSRMHTPPAPAAFFADTLLQKVVSLLSGTEQMEEKSTALGTH